MSESAFVDRDRSNRMKERFLKLDKYYEAVTSKKQQRSELMINGNTGALNKKMTARMKSVNESVEDQPKNNRLNKRVRTIQAESQSNGLKKQPMAMASDLFEKSHMHAAVDEGLDNKVKRRRALGPIGPIPARPIDSDGVPKRALQHRVVDDSHTTCLSPLTKKKALRTPQITHQNREKAMAKETLISQEKDNNGRPTLGQCAGQRPPKVAQTRESNQDDCSASNGTHKSPVYKASPIGPQKIVFKRDNVQSQSEESARGERRLKGKMVNNEADGIRVQNKQSVNAGTPNGCKKNRSKPGRRLKRLSEYEGLSDNVPLQKCSSPNFTGESDDDQEALPAASNTTPHQQTESFFKKYDMDHKEFNVSTPFYQRLLSALIIEDDRDIDGLEEQYTINESSFCPSTLENKCDSSFALRGQSLHLTKKSSPNGSTNLFSIYEDVTLKSFNGCPYDQMSIDEKLLLELQSIGLCNNKMPDLEEVEDEMIQHEVDKMNTTLHQQEVKKKACLEKRSLVKCHKYAKSGSNCFNGIPLKDIFSAPIQNKPEEATTPVSWPVQSKPDPKLLSDEALTINKPTSNRGKNKKLLLNTTATTTTTTTSGDTKQKRTHRASTKPPRAPKAQPKQKTNLPSTPEDISVNNRRNIRIVSRGNDHTNPPSLPIDEEELGVVVVGGPRDLDSLLSFDEEVPEMDLDFSQGLDIPMDDLTQLGMF